MYYAIIGDIVSSKKLSNRDECQQRLNNILKNINDKYADCISSKFLITLGDEFQGLLHSPKCLLDIVEAISFGMHPVDIRFGIGAGEISTGPVGEFALGSDGSAYHRAREVIEEIKKLEKRNKSIETKLKFSGFDEIDCCLLNATAAGQYFIEKRWTQKQRELIFLMLSSEEHTQESVALQLGKGQPSVNSLLKASGYYDYLYMKESITKALCTKAFVDAKKATEINSEDIAAYIEYGMALMELGKYEEAIIYFTKAIKINPKKATIYINRGIALMRLGKYEEAISDFAKAIEIDPWLATPYNNRGIVLMRLGKYEEAISDFAKAIKNDPNNISLYNNRGIASMKLGKQEDATDDFAKAMEIIKNL